MRWKNIAFSLYSTIGLLVSGSCRSQCLRCDAASLQATQSQSIQARMRATASPIPLSKEDLSHFQLAFSKLAEQGDFSVVAEDVPFHSVLTEKASAELVLELDQHRDGTLDDEILAIAHAFDYEPERLGPHMVVLRKRYLDPKDLPFISFEELHHALDAMASVTRTVLPDEPSIVQSDSPLHLIMQSLSTDQQDAIKQGIPIVALREDQRSLVLRFQLAQLRQSTGLETLLHVAHEVDAMADRRAIFEWLDWSHEIPAVGPPTIVFGYACPRGYQNRMLETALSHGYVVAAGGAMTLAYTREQWAKLPKTPEGRIIGPLPDLTAPTSPPTAFVPLTSTVQLDVLPERLKLSGRADKYAADYSPNPVVTRSFHLEIADELKKKPICLFRVESVSPETVVRAVAILYGLDVFQPKSGQFRLEMRRSRKIDSVLDLPAEIERLVPEQWTRLIAGVRQKQEALIGSQKKVEDIRKMLPEQSLRSLPTETRAQMDRLNALQTRYIRDERASSQLYNEAVAQLRAVVQPEMPGTAAGTNLTFSESGDEARRFFALYCLARLTNCIDRAVTQPIPPAVADFNHSFLQINARTGKTGEEVITVNSGITDANEKQTSAGGTTFQIPKTAAVPTP